MYNCIRCNVIWFVILRPFVYIVKNDISSVKSTFNFIAQLHQKFGLYAEVLKENAWKIKTVS